MNIQARSTIEILATIVDQNGVAVDLSQADLVEYHLQKPLGGRVVFTAGLKTDGTDGKISYTTSITDMATAGVWHLQAYYESGTVRMHTNLGYMVVEGNI
jgi:hypothetical protein